MFIYNTHTMEIFSVFAKSNTKRRGLIENEFSLVRFFFIQGSYAAMKSILFLFIIKLKIVSFRKLSNIECPSV